jgi:hypothetical protein
MSWEYCIHEKMKKIKLKILGIKNLVKKTSSSSHMERQGGVMFYEKQKAFKVN